VSFILDALKKSENERQRQTGPGFATVPGSSSRKTRSPWPLVLAGLVAVNLAVLGYILLRDNGDTVSSPLPQSSRPASTETPRIAVPEPAAPAARGTPAGPAAGGTPDREGKAPQEAPPPESSASGPAGSPSTAAASQREVRGLAAEAAVRLPSNAPSNPTAEAREDAAPVAVGYPQTAATDIAAPAADDSLPTANDLRLEGFLTGPPLHLDLHVYYPERHRRVVFISGDKYREGDRVRNGPVVREIVPQGVILEERGRQYLLLPD
jgi:hypothetical protein